MRLLFISNLYEPYDRGGAEVIVKRSIRAAQEAGHEVALFTARPWRDGGRFTLRRELIASDGTHPITVFSCFPANLFFYGDDGKYPYPVRALWHALDVGNRHTVAQLRRVLQEWQPDTVITHNLMGLGFALPEVIQRAGLRHIHVLHDIQLAVRSGLMLYGQEHRFDTDGVAARAYQRLVRHQFGSPDVVVSPSQYLLDFYHQRGYFPNSRKRVLRNPIAERFFRVSVEPSPLFRIGFIGQLAEHKGLRLFISACNVLQRAHPGLIDVSIVGDGALRSVAQEWVQQGKGRRYLGRVPNEQLPDVYRRLDCVVVPTLTYENAPTVVYEALASGVPVCVSDIGGTAEPVQDGVNGFIMKPGDATSVCAAMETAFARRGDLPQMRMSAQKSVLQQDGRTYIETLLADFKNDR